MGLLSPLHVPVTDFVIQPVVAFLAALQAWRCDEREVACVVEVPLRQLTAPGSRTVETREYRGASYRVPLFRYAGEQIWGATSMILAELLWLLGAPPRPQPEGR